MYTKTPENIEIIKLIINYEY